MFSRHHAVVIDDVNSGTAVWDTYPSVITHSMHAEVGVFCTYLTVVTDEPNSSVGDGEYDMRYFALRLASHLEVNKTTHQLK